jgi:uncharacterized protein involved in type VI secretion and phage assembly
MITEITLNSSNLPEYKVVTFHGEESISTLYQNEIIVRPQLWQWTYTFHNQEFVKKSIPDFWEQVLKDCGLTNSD